MKRVIPAIGVRLTLLSAALMLCVATTGAQEPVSGAGQSTITVRGHWTITVGEADGSGVERYEFDNALADARPLLLTLSRQNTASYWNVLVGDVYAVGEPCVGGTPPGERDCILTEPGDTTTFSDAPHFRVLSASLEGLPAQPKLVLQGTFTAQKAGQISYVATGMRVCPNTVAPATPCSSPAGGGFFFTTHSTQPSGAPAAGGPIPVASGQVVQVRVEISFTSAPTT